MRKKEVLSCLDAKKLNTYHARWLMAISALFIPVLILGANNFSDGTDAEWFQRSGSILVGLSVLLQFRFTIYESFINEQLIDFGDEDIRTYAQDHAIRTESSDRYHLEPTGKIVIDLFTFTFAFYGSVIWGYGDLIYKYL